MVTTKSTAIAANNDDYNDDATVVAVNLGPDIAAEADSIGDNNLGDLKQPSIAVATTATAQHDNNNKTALQKLIGISESTLLAPVPVPPKKKRKLHDEFTIAQKLDILEELKGPVKISVPDLAAKHNTSRTSIYRWKNDEERLLNLMIKDGKGGNKRSSQISKEIVQEQEQPPQKQQRKSNNEEYTAAEKLAVIRELKGKNAPSVRTLAEKVGANHRSIYRWKKDEARLIQLVEQDGRGDVKRSGGDPLLRIKEGLKIFAAANGDKPLTGTMIATKAKQIRTEMLAQHELTPYLTAEEVKGMKDFTGSTSWGRKIVQKYGWKGGVGASDAAVTDEQGKAEAAAAGDDGETTAEMLPTAIKLPTISEISKVAKTKRRAKKAAKSGGEDDVSDLKREITTLKKKLHDSEMKVMKLTLESSNLKSQLGGSRYHKWNERQLGAGGDADGNANAVLLGVEIAAAAATTNSSGAAFATGNSDSAVGVDADIEMGTKVEV